MLHQNWFMDKRFEMFEDYVETQSFYDTQTGNIYIVSEDYEECGTTLVQEITKESAEYEANYEKYKETQLKTYRVKLIMSDEFIVEAKNPDEAERIARDKFGNDYLVDESVITEIGEKPVATLKTFPEMVLDTLYAYREINKEVLSQDELEDLDSQILYMEEQIEEDKGA